MRISLEHGIWEENPTLHAHPESWRVGLGKSPLQPALAGARLGILDTSVNSPLEFERISGFGKNTYNLFNR